MSGKRLSGRFLNYLRSPLWFLLIPAGINPFVYMIDRRAGALVSAGIGAWLIAEVILYVMRKRWIEEEMVAFAVQYSQVQKEILADLPVPFGLVDGDGNLFWMNRALSELSGIERKKIHRDLDGIFPELTREVFPLDYEPSAAQVVFEDRILRAEIQKVEAGSMFRESSFFNSQYAAGEDFYTVAFYDETELQTLRKRCEDEALAAGIIYIDNYDEALESVEEVRRSLLTALIERKLTKYFRDLDAIVKKYENDKYILILTHRSLQALIDGHFDILQQVKTINIGNDMEVTISMGIGEDQGSLYANLGSARMAMDLALGRGGDQVVLKKGDADYFFGGNKEAVEKNTRVKARVKAQALQEFIAAQNRIVIMAHKLVDADGFGAAIGLFRAARSMDKKPRIVIDRVTSTMRPLIDSFRQSADYDEDIFINLNEARNIVDKDTLLIVVDTSKPSYTECPQLLQQTDTIVVMDHHRQGEEAIQNAVLSYIEPYASSACEMVAEILQYFSTDVRLRKLEADALYAGIMVDTDNFMQKTGVRTFEAAAYLRRNGADLVHVRKLFREDMNDYRARGETIRNAEVYRDDFVISICPSDYVESPTIAASRSANELLNIIGVRASFVLTEYNNQIYISARAIDEFNVQRVMERMGGGGHFNMAGCQLEMSMDQAVGELKKTLDVMLQEGEVGI